MGKYASSRRYLSEDEFDRLREHVRLNCRLDDRVLFSFLCLGMRISECLGVMRSGLDLNLRTVSFQRRKQKQATIDTLPIPDDFRFDLEAVYHSRPFPPDWKVLAFNRITAWKRLKAWGRMTGVAWVSPHILRHTFAIRWVSRGGALTELSRWLGHRSAETTTKYLLWCPEDLRRKGVEIGMFSRGGSSPGLPEGGANGNA